LGRNDGDIKICNLTARRIAVANRTAPGDSLLLPPFGERVVAASRAAEYDFDPWSAQQLVLVGECAVASQTARRRRTSVLCFISGYSCLATLVVCAVALAMWSLAWGLVAVGLGLFTLGCAGWAGWDGDAWANMLRSLNIFFGLMLSFGAPAAAILFMSAEVDLPLDGAPELRLALVLLWLFLSMAASLPAALFLFFHRQKVPTLRANFFRDVVRLDPNVQTTLDAETCYDDLVKDVFGSGTSGASLRGRLPILAATGVISGLWIWTLVPGLQHATSMREILVPEPDIVTFAFLGSYVFAINMLFRRYARADLGPKAYTNIMIRIFAAVASTWVLSFAPFARTDGRPAALMLLLAFFVGIVPETGTAIVQDILQQWKPIARAIPTLGEEHPLSRLGGMSLYDRAQLLEVGIESVEGLAHHNIIDLMLWTRVPTTRLVDFVDQAVLYLHVRGASDARDDKGDVEQARLLLARHGIRTATDLERAYALAAARSVEEGERLLGLLDTPTVAVHRLGVMMDAMEDDEWMVHVRNWRDQSAYGEPVRTVGEFVRVSTAASSRAQPTTPEEAADLEEASTQPGPAKSPVSLAAG